jgi:hypothetical protein
VTDRATDNFIEQVAAELRRPVRLDPSFDDRVMAAVEAPDVIPLHPETPLPTRTPWYGRPLTLRVSPLSLAMAAGLMGILAVGLWRLEPIQQVQVATQPAESGNLVPVTNSESVPLVVQQFTFYQKGLKSVSVVGSFNDWDDSATPMKEVSEGVWSVSLPLRPDVYQYQFILDGDRRVTDPSMPEVASDFGSPNSVVTVTPKGR